MPQRIQDQAEMTNDGRAFRRLPIQRRIRYRVLGERKKFRKVGLGKTLNMSAGGVLFTTESQLPEGEHIELVVSWLTRFGDALPVKLILTGRLVRAGSGQAAMSIDRYEFRAWLT